MIERVPARGRTLIRGPSRSGKTRLTARALERWIDLHGPADIVVLEFAPQHVRKGSLVGGRIERFMDIPEDVWMGKIEAHAPRLEGHTPADSLRLARVNADRAKTVIEAMPASPVAVFVNDVTIAFQSGDLEPEALLVRIEGADCAVLNAYDGEEFGDGSISDRELTLLARFSEWADDEIALEPG